MSNYLDPHIRIGAITLSVENLQRSIEFYQEKIGLTTIEQGTSSAFLGIDDLVLVKLLHQPGAMVVRGVTGLYHFAIRVPSRLDLGRILVRLLQNETKIAGGADHLVSEAVYLSDPDGHGIEIYHDRPRDSWYDSDGNLVMDTKPLDVQGLINRADQEKDYPENLPSGTVMGHMHLHVSDLKSARQFYMDGIGFKLSPLSKVYPGVLFLNASGYHHHLAINTWAGVGASAPPENAARMLNYELRFHNQESIEPVLKRLQDLGTGLRSFNGDYAVADPSGNMILLRADGD